MKDRFCPCCKQPYTYLPQELIIDICLQRFGVSWERLVSKNRAANLVLARQVLFFLLRKYTNLTVCEIGGLLNRDHTTVVYATGKMYDYIETKQAPYQDIEEIERILINPLKQSA